MGGPSRMGGAARGAAFARLYARGALAMARLATVGIFDGRDRAELHDLVARDRWRGSRIPILEAEELLLGLPSLELHEPAAREGNVTLLELAVLVAVARRRRPETLFEIGTFDGRTTLNLAASAPEGARVHTLDLPRAGIDATRYSLASSEEKFIDKDASGARFAGTPWASRIEQHHGDSARFDFAPWRGRVDFVFVDGSHAYDYVLSDTERALAMLAPAGVVLWHDFDPRAEGVYRAIHELWDRGAPFDALQHVAGTSLVMLERG